MQSASDSLQLQLLAIAIAFLFLLTKLEFSMSLKGAWFQHVAQGSMVSAQGSKLSVHESIVLLSDWVFV